MIISADKKMKSPEIGGVVFLCRPPTGDLEIEIIAIVGESIDQDALSKSYASACAEIDAELKGKRQPKKEEREALIKKRMAENITEKTDVRKELTKVSRVVDMVLCGWESEKQELPLFPADGRPSQLMQTRDKQELFNWYFSQYQLGVDEAKN